MDLAATIRNIPDFPQQGIIFRDITTLLSDKDAHKYAVDEFANLLKSKQIDYIVAAESRGFLFAGTLSYLLNCGLVPIRKSGKLPYKTYKSSYSLEYGKDSLEIHQDAFTAGSKVLILDDLLATGGTVSAMVDLVKQLKGEIVGVAFLIELTDLKGRDKLKDYPVYSLIKY